MTDNIPLIGCCSIMHGFHITGSIVYPFFMGQAVEYALSYSGVGTVEGKDIY